VGAAVPVLPEWALDYSDALDAIVAASSHAVDGPAATLPDAAALEPALVKGLLEKAKAFPFAAAAGPCDGLTRLTTARDGVRWLCKEHLEAAAGEGAVAIAAAVTSSAASTC
jgi:hypothetical protein